MERFLNIPILDTFDDRFAFIIGVALVTLVDAGVIYRCFFRKLLSRFLIRLDYTSLLYKKLSNYRPNCSYKSSGNVDFLNLNFMLY